MSNVQHPVAHESPRNLTLDAWRGFSVSLVIFYHAIYYRFANVFNPISELEPIETSTVLGTLLANGHHAFFQLVVYAGPLGVKFFFVISGYIITKLLLTEHENCGKISLVAFYVRRACRILPALWLFIVCVVFATSQGWINVAPRSVLFALAFLCNTSTTACYSDWFVVHLWSLSLEEQFYFVWPVVVVFFLPRAIPRIAIALMVGFLALAQFSLMFVGEFNNGLSFACIAVGALYASSPVFQKRIETIATKPAIALAVLLLFGRPLIPLLFPGQFRLHDLLTPGLICFVIFSSFRYRATVERVLAVRALARVGLLSYGLYVWQQLFLAAPDYYLSPSMLTQPYLLVPTVLVSYFAVEKPFIQLGSRLSRQLRETQELQADSVRGRIA